MTRFRIFLILGIVFTILFIIILIWSFLKIASPQPQPQIPSPTQYPSGTRGSNRTQIHYDKRATDELLRIVTERPTPAPSDQSIRNELINSLGDQSGTLFETDQIRIEYVKAPNDFEVEIKTIDIASAKEIAVAWFRQKGFSDESICKLPVVFYLSSQVRQEIQDTYTFNPLPDHCL